MKPLLATVLVFGLLALTGLAAAIGSHPFTDVEPDAYYAQPVQWAHENEITTGTSDTSFSPDDPVTRGQVVTFLQRYHEALGSAAGPAGPQGPEGPAGPAGADGVQFEDLVDELSPIYDQFDDLDTYVTIAIDDLQADPRQHQTFDVSGVEWAWPIAATDDITVWFYCWDVGFTSFTTAEIWVESFDDFYMATPSRYMLSPVVPAAPVANVMHWQEPDVILDAHLLVDELLVETVGGQYIRLTDIVVEIVNEPGVANAGTCNVRYTLATGEVDS